MSEEENNTTGRPRKATQAKVNKEEEETSTNEETEPQEDVVDVFALKEELEKLRKELADRDAAETTDAPKTGTFLIHMVSDGLTLLGQMTYRGQEFEFDTNSQAYKDTQDLSGFSILEWRRNPRKQEEVLGKVYFREGPWTGKTFADIKYEALKKLANQTSEEAAVTMKEVAEIEKLDAKRRSTPQPLAPIIGGSARVGNRTGY